jgi:subtilase-type serine protease
MAPKSHFFKGACALAMVVGSASAHANPWNLTQVGAHATYRLGHTATGILVGVIDTGIDPNHPAFRGRIDSRSRPPFSLTPRGMFDDNGHGTHVAGIIAGAKNVGPTHGIAPDASLLILGSLGNWAFNTNQGLRYAAELGAKVVNGSYGPPAIPARFLYNRVTDKYDIPNPDYVVIDYQVWRYYTEEQAPANLREFEALEAAAAADVLMVFAAGNEKIDQPIASRNPSGAALAPLIRPKHGLGAYRFVDEDPPDFRLNNPKTYRFVPIDAPGMARLDYSHLQGALIAVVATDNTNKIAPYSNHCGDTALWCMAAPGGARDQQGKLTAANRILSTLPQGKYGVMQGTSMAAPLVAGAAAVMRGAFPYFTARQTIEVMLTTTNRSGHLVNRAIYGRGLMDLGRAIQGPGEFGAEGYGQVFDVDTQGNDSTWSGNITGTGGLVKRGPGNLTMTSSNRYSGPTRVVGGQLTMDGLTPTSQFHVEPGATLGGTGRVGSTTMAGTLEPGRLTGTLAVAGDYTHLPTGTFVATLGPAGQSNHLAVDGAAVIQGGTLQVYGITAASLGHDYNLLSAHSGISGDFAAKPHPYLFIDLASSIVNHPANGQRYHLSVTRNAGGFGVVAHSPNQHAVAHAMDQMGPGAPVFDSLLMTRQASTAQTALTQLAGDIHASVLSALVQQGSLTREAVIGQLRRDDDLLPKSSLHTGGGMSQSSLWAQHVGDWGRPAGLKRRRPAAYVLSRDAVWWGHPHEQHDSFGPGTRFGQHLLERVPTAGFGQDRRLLPDGFRRQ